MIVSFRKADLLMLYQEVQEKKRIEAEAFDKENLKDHPLDSLPDNPNIDEIIRAAVADTIEALGYEFHNEHEAVALPTGSSNGFWNHTNGGYEAYGQIDLAYMEGSGSYPANKKLNAMMNKLEQETYNQSRDGFIKDNEAELKKIFGGEINVDKVNYHDLNDLEQSDMAEKLSELEYENQSEYTFSFYIKVFYYSPDNRHKKSRNNKPTLLVQGGVEDCINYDALVKEFSFSTLTELKTKLDYCMAIIKKKLE